MVAQLPNEASCDVIRRGGVTFVRANCRKCGAHEEIVETKHLPVEVIAKKFEQRGWNCRRKNNWRCPECEMPRRYNGDKMDVIEKTKALLNKYDQPQPKPADIIAASVTVGGVAAVASPAPPKPDKEDVMTLTVTTPTTDLAPASPPVASLDFKKRFQIAKLIEGSFNVDLGAYRPGWSDKRIATANHLNIEEVAQVRKELGFEFKRPPELDQYRGMVNKLQADSAAASEMIVDLQKRLDDIVKRINRFEEEMEG